MKLPLIFFLEKRSNYYIWLL